MVKSDTLGGIDVVLFGFALIPILLLGLTDNVAAMLFLCFMLIIVRLAVQFALRNRVVSGSTSKYLRLDRWSFNSMFLSVGGSIAIVFGFDGGLFVTALIAIPILVSWFILNHVIYDRGASFSDEI